MGIRVLSLGQNTVEEALQPDGGARVRRWTSLNNRLGSLDYYTFQPGARPLSFYYPDSENSFYVLHGRGQLLDLDSSQELAFETGQFLHAPPGIAHALQTSGDASLVVVGGPCPPAGNAYLSASAHSYSRRTSPESLLMVLGIEQGVDIPLIRPPRPGGFARFPIWPRTGGHRRSMNCVVMKPGQENVPHVHPVSEDIFYVLSGNCVIENGDTGHEHPFKGGSLIFIDPGTTHAVKSLGPEDYMSVGGPCPADVNLFKRFGLM